MPGATALSRRGPTSPCGSHAPPATQTPAGRKSPSPPVQRVHSDSPRKKTGPGPPGAIVACAVSVTPSLQPQLSAWLPLATGLEVQKHAAVQHQQELQLRRIAAQRRRFAVRTCAAHRRRVLCQQHLLRERSGRQTSQSSSPQPSPPHTRPSSSWSTPTAPCTAV